MIERFDSHTACERTVADHGDMPGIFVAIHGIGHRHAKRGGNRSGTMRSAERVMFAFGRFRETRQAFVATKRSKTIQASGEHFVRVGLMPHVKNNFVARRIENVMKRNG